MVIDNVLFIKPTNNSVYGYSDTNSRRWTVNNVTSYCPNIRGNCLRIRGGDHTISNSIFYDGNIWLPDQVSLKNNCTWETSGHDIGTEAELKFANANPNDYATIHDDFTLLPNSPCQSAGSTITSVAQLLNR